MAESIELDIPPGHHAVSEAIGDGRVRVSLVNDSTGQVVEFRELPGDAEVRVQGRSLPLPSRKQTRG